MKRLILLALAVLSLAACRSNCCPNAVARLGEEATTERVPRETREGHSGEMLPMSKKGGDLLITGANMKVRSGKPGGALITGDNLSLRRGDLLITGANMKVRSGKPGEALITGDNLSLRCGNQTVRAESIWITSDGVVPKLASSGSTEASGSSGE